MKKLLFILVILILYIPRANAQLTFTEVEITASGGYTGPAPKALLQIRLVSGRGNVIRKPFIVVEGFDPGHIVNPEERYGSSDLVKNFLPDISASGSSQLQNLFGMSSDDYDIIYVNWKTGTDLIQRNALVLEDVIRYVNAQKQPLNGVRQHNVIMGRSMGGLVSRYALRRMENNSENHETSLYISWDASHQGANVPQGFQHLARHARDLYIRTGGTATLTETIQLIRGGMEPIKALGLANTPAARQMLVNYINDLNEVDNSTHSIWQNALSTMGYPQGVPGIPFRKIAISNGSECAETQGFTPGESLVSIDGTIKTTGWGDLAGMFIFPATMPIAAAMLNQPVLGLTLLPGSNRFEADIKIRSKSYGIGNEVYKNKLTYKKKILWSIPVTAIITNKSHHAQAATLPYDYYPGGFMEIPLNLQDRVTNGDLMHSDITAFNQERFCFIPVTSALDIGGITNTSPTHLDNLQQYVGAAPPIDPKSTPFENFITAFDITRINVENEKHVYIGKRNGDWAAAELNRTSVSDPVPLADCRFACNGDPLEITGDGTFCTTSNEYSVLNLPAGANVTWSAIPATVVTINCPTCPTTTISKDLDASFTLTATINNACSNVPVILTKENIRVGKPSAVGIVSFSEMELCEGVTGFEVLYTHPLGYRGVLNVDAINATSITWTLVSAGAGWTWGYSNGGKTLNVNNKTANRTLTLKARASNACGFTERTYTFRSGVCIPLIEPGRIAGPDESPGIKSYVLSPNPSQGNVVISAKTNNTFFTSLIISDITGTRRKLFKYGKGTRTASINLSDLHPGSYIVEITDGIFSERQTLIINK